MSKVTLGQLRFRLHTQEGVADALQNRCSLWFREQLEHELSTLLTDYASAAVTLQVIEHMLIKVGDIPLSRFESEMNARVMVQLKQQLQRENGGVGTTNGLIPGPHDPTVIVPGQREVGASEKFIQLLHYLDSGQGQAVSLLLSGSRREGWLRQALGEALPLSLHNQPGKMVSPRTALALSLLHPPACQRLVAIWPGESLSFLAAWLLAPQRLPTVVPADALWMLPLAALIALKSHSMPEGGWRALPVASSEMLSRVTTLFDALREQNPRALVSGSRGSPAEPVVEPVLNRWLEALLHPPLPASLKGATLRWLGESAYDRILAVRLAEVPVAVQHRLHKTLGLRVNPQQRSDLRVMADAHSRHLTQDQDTRSLERPETVEHAHTPDTPVSVTGAGLVLLWPLLPRLFNSFGWLDEGDFVDDSARWQAVGALEWLAWGSNAPAEDAFPGAALLCGCDWKMTFDDMPPADIRQVELNAWLEQALASVPLLSRCNANDIRAFFLQRSGFFDETDRVLTMVSEAPDALLCQLPWPLTQVMLPWLLSPVRVDWR